MKTQHVGVFAFIFIGAIMGIGALPPWPGWPLAKLTVRVVDEQGLPLSAANVGIGFREKLSNKDARVTGATDAKGEFAAEGHSDMRLLSSARKDGFYVSGSSGTVFNDQANGKWVPWNPVAQIIMRPIGKPLALFAKRVQMDVPVLDQPCGFDFEKGDWVAPHGKGVVSDFTFTIHASVKGFYDYFAEATIAFAQPRDGLARMSSPAIARSSALRWERSAPDGGYVTSHTLRIQGHDPRSGKQPDKTFDLYDRDRGYFFRVRTVEREGRIVAANYGKIAGDIGIDPRDTKTCTVFFTYYYNPTLLDQNLEWDITRNLLSGLSAMEAPREP